MHQIPSDKKSALLYALSPGVIFKMNEGTPACSPLVAIRAWNHAVRLHAILSYTSSGSQHDGGLIVMDPCCGNGTNITTTALLSRIKLKHVVGCDIDPKAVVTAKNNMHMITTDSDAALDWPINPKEYMCNNRPNADMQNAIRSRMQQLMDDRVSRPSYTIHQHDCTNPLTDELGHVIHEGSVHVCIVDPPHGRQSTWKQDGGAPHRDAKHYWTLFFHSIAQHLAPSGVLCVIQPQEEYWGAERCEWHQEAGLTRNATHRLKRPKSREQRYAHLFTHGKKIGDHVRNIY